MFEMIFGIAISIISGFGIFAMSENIDDYMQNHNHITQLDA